MHLQYLYVNKILQLCVIIQIIFFDINYNILINYKVLIIYDYTNVK